MKISSIMNTNVDGRRLETQLPAHTDLFDLTASDIRQDQQYEVVDENGGKVGEIEGEKLHYLVKIFREMNFPEIIDDIHDGIIVVDRDGRICYQNTAYGEILGVPIRKVIGKSLYKIEKDALLLTVLETGKPAAKERQLIKSLNKYVSMRAYPILRNDQVEGVYSIFRDVTELSQLNNEVARITQVAEEYSSQIQAASALNESGVISSDAAFRTLIHQAEVVAKTDATVLIRGENGAGKEVLTKLIHQNSARSHKPLITVNCAAIPENLIESELFGYEEGSFTGSKKGGKMGKFQLAEGGTLFLDEIGDMPLTMQTKLLRVLQEGEIEKIGREENVPVNVRIIAATNQPLEEMILDKTFRQDLYYRLNVISFQIPPLRERKTDIILLARHFLERYNERYHKNVTIHQNVYDFLEGYPWPGNVRELQNCVEACVIMCTGKQIQLENLPGQMKAHLREVLPSEEQSQQAEAGLLKTSAPNVEKGGGSFPRFAGSLKEQLSQYEREAITDAIGRCGGDKDAAAAFLGISRRSLYRKLSER